jgi:Ca-activated chloride channel family protein
MKTATASTLATQPASSAGGRLIALDGRALPLLGTRLTATAAGGLCRVVLEQRFKNSHAEPLRVSYLFPLPHDGAVSGFAFRLGDRRIVGEVDKLASARERFEEALVEGRTAALLEQVRGSVFSQELGNVPPGAEVVAELTIDQRLAWLPEGAWEWRFPTALAPRYQGAEGRVPDAGKLEVAVADGELPARLQLSLAVSDRLTAGGALGSPTHALQLRFEGGASHAGLQAEGGAPLDRDVAIRWPVATAEVGLALDLGRSGAKSRVAGRVFGLLSVVPPTPGALEALPRDLIVLLDTSGSMSGRPLDQAKAVVGALIGSLTEADTLELIEFSNAPRRWKSKPVTASVKARTQALAWLEALNAGGSTEMTDALYAALEGLRDEAQRQVVLVTDGEIGFEAEIVKTIMAKLTPGSRLHTVGVGSSVNRSLTGPAARAGRGVEVVLDLDEPADAAAARLLQRTVAPAVTELTVSGSALVACATRRLPDLFGGAPALLSMELAPAGGTLTVTGQTAAGRFERTVRVDAEAANEAAAGNGAVAALYAREVVEELELLTAAGDGDGYHDLAIERLGLEFQISTRLTSWVAISDEATVDPRKPTRRETMPQQLPYGMSVEGLGLRRSAPGGVEMASMELGAMRQYATASTEMSSVDDSPRGQKSQRKSHDAPSERPPAGRPVPPRPPSPAQGYPAPRESKEEKAKLKGRASPFRSLAARLVLRAVDRLVVEFEVPEDGFDWSPGTHAQARLADGRMVEVEVDLKTTTAEGELEGGTTVRLVLRLAQPLTAQQVPVGVELADSSLELSFPPGSP